MGINRLLPLSFFLVLLFSGTSCYSKKVQSYTPPAKDGFALVELFTSEGCSSCPPAEAALAEIKGEYPKNVYVMEYHVDYWNYIGWKDVFSSSEYTKRQQDYARQFNLSSTYTPQAVINGKNELVGSDREKLHTIINADLQKKATATIQLSAKATGSKVSVDYTTNAPGQILNIALVQKEAETNVKRGENSGRKLKHINIVRALKTVPAQGSGTVSIDFPPGLSAQDCIIIAYTQRKKDMEVMGASEAAIN